MFQQLAILLCTPVHIMIPIFHGKIFVSDKYSEKLKSDPSGCNSKLFFQRFVWSYMIFQASKKEDEEKAQYAREFIEALLELTESDVNAVVGPKNMPDEPENHYAPEGGLLVLISVILLLKPD